MSDDAETQVLVLGGGAAGLAAAARLAAAGMTTRIVEARARLGGRILTITDPAVPLPVDLGAEFVHGRAEPVWALLKECGAPAFDVPNRHWQRRGEALEPLDFARELGRIMQRLERIGSNDISFAQFLEQHCAEPELREPRRLAQAFVEGFDAADPNIASARAIKAEQEGVGNVGAEPQFRVLGGYSRLIQFLESIVRAADIAIETSRQVTEIHWRRGHVAIMARDQAGRGHRFEATSAVITLPLPCLCQHVIFHPQLSMEKLDAIARLGFGSVVKVVLLFHEPFWESESVATSAGARESLADASFLHDPDARFPTWWTALPLRLPMLTAWAGGPKAAALHGLSPDQLVNVALETLEALLHVPVARLRELLIWSRAHDWLADPFARGAYSYILVNGMGARERLAQPVENTLFFAGEATDVDEPGTVAGALASGERAAREVLESL